MTVRLPLFCVSILALATLAAGAAQAQTPPALKPGTIVKVELKTKLDTKKSKPGDKVSAQVKDDVKDGHTVLLAKNSYLLGTVTTVMASDHGTPARIGVLFNQITDKKGAVLGQLRAAIVHVEKESGGYQLSVPTELGGSGAPLIPSNNVAMHSGDVASNGVPISYGLMQTYNGSGADLGGVIESAKDNFHIDKDTHLQVRVLASGN